VARTKGLGNRDAGSVVSSKGRSYYAFEIGAT
jgi:hypothetical protein